MKNFILTLILAVIISGISYAQDLVKPTFDKKYSIVMGYGNGLNGEYGTNYLASDIDLNAKIGKYLGFNTGFSFGAGSGKTYDDFKKYSFSSYIYSYPFGNNKRNQLRFGAGIFYAQIQESNLSYLITREQGSGIIQNSFLFSKEGRIEYGAGFSMENNYMFNQNFSVGFKLDGKISENNGYYTGLARLGYHF